MFEVLHVFIIYDGMATYVLSLDFVDFGLCPRGIGNKDRCSLLCNMRTV